MRKEDLILPYKLFLAILSIYVCITCLAQTESEAGKAIPINLFNIGNSIGEGEAADGTIGEKQHDTVWSTGYNRKDIVFSLNERFEAADPTGYYENNAARDAVFNHAVSGSEMDDFVDQANEVIAAIDQTPSRRAGLVAILLGNGHVEAKIMAQGLSDWRLKPAGSQVDVVAVAGPADV